MSRLYICVVLLFSFLYLKADPIIISSIDQTQEICNLGNGTLQINASGGAGPLFYSIDGGTNFQESNFFDGLESGDYLIIVTDGIACSEISTAQIADAPEPLLDIFFTCIDTLNAVDINLEPFDGISPYTFNWLGPNGATYSSEDLNNVEPGIYSITVTDALGCEIDSVITIPTCCVMEIECGIPDTLFMSCIEELPEIDSIFLDQVSINNEDEAALNAEGITIISSCHTITAEIIDTSNNPQVCGSDSLIITREFIITDGVYTTSCFRYFVIEEYAPIMVTQEAQNASFACNQDIDARLEEWLNNIAGAQFEICSEPLSVTTDPFDPQVNYACAGRGSVEVSFFLEDGCGNRDTTIATFSVFDNIGPSISCPMDLSIEVQQISDLDQIDNWLNDAQPFDACGPVVVANDYNAINLSDDCEASTLVTFTATDDCGNSNTCRANITVENNLLPLIDCPATLVVDCGNSSTQEISTWLVQAQGESAFGTVLPVNNNYSALNFENLICGESLDVIFTVEDDCQRNNSCSSNILLTDNTAPEITCPPSFTIDALAENNSELVENWLLQPSTSDLCTDVILSNNFDPGLLDDLCALNQFEVVFTATDLCSNENSCSGLIEVNKSQPSINCPAPLVIDCEDEDLETNISNWIGTTSAEDGQSNILQVIDNFNFTQLNTGCSETNDVLFVAEDDCGQRIECSAQIIVTDNTPPSIQCPDDLDIDVQTTDDLDQIDSWLENTVQLDACGMVTVQNDYSNIMLSDDCDIASQVTFTASDDCGNSNTCQANINIRNNINPSISCPLSLTVECGQANSAEISDWIDSATGTTIIGSALLVTSDFSYSDLENLTCGESHSVIFSVEDNCQRTNFCSSDIMIVDNTAPDITCPEPISIEALATDNLENIENWLLQPSASDLCTDILISNDFDPGNLIDLCDIDEIQILFTAEDLCGNRTTCPGIIEIVKSPPTINCPPILELECEDTNFENTISSWLSTAFALDIQSNTIPINNNYDQNNLIFGCQESSSITFSTQDDCNQTAECFSQIRITDSTAPTIECPEDITIDLKETDFETTFENWQNSVSANDGCGVFDVVYNDQLIVSFDACEIMEPYEYVVFDNCDNSNSCISNLTLINDYDISIICPEDITVACGQPQTPALIDGFLNQSIVESDLTYLVFDNFSTETVDLNCEDENNIDILFSAEDECGNLAECYSNIHFIPKMKIYIPNIFSPNSDDLNDTFTIYGNSSLNRIISLIIFDRWGSKVYEATDFPPNDANYGWHGKINNTEVSNEVYTYLLLVEDIFNQEHQFSGSIQAIK